MLEFGWPDELVDIHFPRGKLPPNSSQPWYYYLTVQTPTFFQYIGSQLGGHGWQCTENLPVIRILPIDSQPMKPTSPVGFGSVEEAIARTNAGEPISQDAWGRINFKNSFFWKVVGRDEPKWASFKNGFPTNRVGDGHEPIKFYLQKAIESWRDRWQTEAATWNGMTNNVAGSGDYGQYGAGLFSLPVPGAGVSTFPIPELQANPDKYYFGPIPPTVIFQRGHALVWKQSFAFKYEIAQLDPFEWDMSVMPPQRAGSFKGTNTARKSSAITGKYGGYNNNIAFPLTSPIIGGTA